MSPWGRSEFIGFSGLSGIVVNGRGPASERRGRRVPLRGNGWTGARPGFGASLHAGASPVFGTDPRRRRFPDRRPRTGAWGRPWGGRSSVVCLHRALIASPEDGRHAPCSRGHGGGLAPDSAVVACRQAGCVASWTFPGASGALAYDHRLAWSSATRQAPPDRGGVPSSGRTREQVNGDGSEGDAASAQPDPPMRRHRRGLDRRRLGSSSWSGVQGAVGDPRSACR
jgi:hypothetical protein